MAERSRRPRRIPERTCIGCRRRSGPDRLVRVAIRPDGSLGLGRTEPGRGAWVCAGSVACFDTAVKRRAFDRALRRQLPSPELARLRERLLGEDGSASHGPAGRDLEGVGGA